METSNPWPACQDANVGMVRAHAILLMRRLRNVFPRWSPTIAVAVLTAERHRRRTLQRKIKGTARQLERTSPLGPPIKVGVIVQHCLGSEQALAGCYQINQRSDGSCGVLFRLALAVDGRCLDIDSILAVFAEEWIGLVSQQADGPSVSVPIELLSTAPTFNGREGNPRPNGWEFRSDGVNLTGRVA